MLEGKRRYFGENMNVKNCDRCGNTVTDSKSESTWDKSFGRQYHGVIFTVRCEGNYMNSPIDLCKNCKLYGIAQLMKQNPGFHEYLDTDQINRLKACIEYRSK